MLTVGAGVWVGDGFGVDLLPPVLPPLEEVEVGVELDTGVGVTVGSGVAVGLGVSGGTNGNSSGSGTSI